jgi:hypothetical protein
MMVDCKVEIDCVAYKRKDVLDNMRIVCQIAALPRFQEASSRISLMV